MARPDFDTLDLPMDPASSGKPVMVFYDCEFTDLTSHSDLLSIGFTAAESDSELYIEVADANRALASQFVRQEVLPLFGQHNPQVLRRAGAAARIEQWLDGLRDGDRQRQINMLADSTWDWQFLLDLFIPMPGEQPWTSDFNIVGRMVQQLLGSGRQMAGFNEAMEAYHRQHKQRHHALVDARALKTAYLEASFS
jgi:hypothetical protein